MFNSAQFNTLQFNSTPNFPKVVQVYDPLSVTDVASVYLGIALPIWENIAVFDVASAIDLQVQVTGVEWIGVSDGSSQYLDYLFVFGSDSVATSEDTHLFDLLALISNEDVTVAENVTLFDLLVMSHFDTITVSDVPTFMLMCYIGVSDSIVLVDILDINMPLDLPVSDAVSITEDVRLFDSLDLIISDALGVTENAVYYNNDPPRLRQFKVRNYLGVEFDRFLGGVHNG